MARVELQQVTKRFGDFQAVGPVDLVAEEGEFLVLLGPSGCGKSTTMRMIAGLDDVTSGRVLFDGTDMGRTPPADRDVAMVFQSYALYPNLTVFENIRFPLKMRKMARGAQEALVREAAERVGLSDQLAKRPSALSGGQKQRVALARAIVRQPRVFLMDEPLSNLDHKLRLSTRAHIRHLTRDLGVTTIYVTHDQAEAMTLADRIVVMRKGQIVQVGTPRELYERPGCAFVAGFVGSPAMNLMRGRIRGGVFRGEDVQIEGLAADDGEVILGFRAEEAQVLSEHMGFTGCEISAPLYELEPLGDCVMVLVEAGGAMVTARAPREFEARPGDRIRIVVPPNACHVFDAETGARRDPAARQGGGWGG
ncbi:ABC transporter ATP-binding protein [Mangrovicoccus algicola]|uniref:ABC transporter ATP-binding protein n=1 Tax=Mangrovicoccus algicola TaxID=2771008 RepID=A0A8J6YVP6_9RHOB|nr:ABC transporter ATP-binding protein [Mangrovicoccus algicola]MBE3638497.1 ABC transporter ATP-binding protein [Mangrovicoccus algicola]